MHDTLFPATSCTIPDTRMHLRISGHIQSRIPNLVGNEVHEIRLVVAVVDIVVGGAAASSDAAGSMIKRGV